MDAGQTLLENGGEVFRAQQTMEIMAASLGVRDFHVYVLTNGIFASAHLPGRDAVSLVRHVPTVSIHLGRVEAVNELSRELAAGRLGVVEAEARLNTARTLPRSTPQLEILACVVGAAGFAYLFGGTLADMPVAAVAGLLEALVCQQFARHGINRIFTDIVAAFCGTIWAIAVQTVVPTVIVILGSCFFRVIWVYTIFAHFHTIPALYLLYPCSWTLTAFAEILYFVHCYKQSMALFKEPQAA